MPTYNSNLDGGSNADADVIVVKDNETGREFLLTCGQSTQSTCYTVPLEKETK